jgi:hypothetical protein
MHREFALHGRCLSLPYLGRFVAVRKTDGTMKRLSQLIAEYSRTHIDRVPNNLVRHRDLIYG